MPRRARSDLSGYPLHVTQRGNNRAACFFVDADRRAYLRWLGIYAEKFQVAVHAWALMTNHVHLLVTPDRPSGVSLLMQALGRRYVAYVNAAHDRTGTLWEGRFRACPVHADDYLLACMRYIEMNPVRAGLVAKPGDHPWSSYSCNALGKIDALTTPHIQFLRLGADDLERQANYRELFDVPVSDATLAAIRSSTAAGCLLAHAPVRKRLEEQHGWRLGSPTRGRPRKESRTKAPSTKKGSDPFLF